MQSPLVNSDHAAVKLSLRIKIKLSRKGRRTEKQMMQRLDFSRIRPHHPKFDPRAHFDFIAAVEANVLKDEEDHTCERLQTALHGQHWRRFRKEQNQVPLGMITLPIF